MKKSSQPAAPRRKTSAEASSLTRDNSLKAAATAEQIAQFYEDVDAALFSLIVEPRQQLRVLCANRSFLATAGLRRHQVINQRIEQIIPKPSCTRVLKQCREAIRSRQTVRWDETYSSPSGIKYGKISVTPVMDAKGRVTHLSGSINDITKRRRSEQALHESEERYRRIVQTAEEGIWTINASSLTDYVNPKMAQMMGYEAEEMIGRPISDFLDAEGKALLAVHIKNRKKGISAQFEFKYMRKDGSALWALVSTNPITDSHGVYVGALALLTDISERRQVEQSLARTTDLLERTGEMAKIGGWVLEVAAKKLFWSLETCRLFEIGGSSAPPLEQAIQFYAPSAQPIIRKAVQAAIDHGTPYELELQAITAKGRYFWARSQGSAIRKNGRTVQLIGTFQDITEHKEAAQALSASEVRFRAMFEQAVVGVGLMDFSTRRFVDVNRRYCTITGRSRKELLKIDVDEITHPDDRARNHRLHQQLKAAKSSEFQVEQRYVRQDGSVVWVNLNASLLSTVSGRPNQMLVMVEDITSRKLAEANYRRELGFNEILASHTSAIIILLDRHGRLIHANEATLQMLGYKRKDLVGKPPPWKSDFMDPAEKIRSQKRFKEMLAGKNIPTKEVTLIGKDRKRHVVALSSIITKTPEGVVDRIIVTGTDLTERNRLQKEILKISEQEQARIGHNLHDGVGQTMTGVSSLIEALEAELAGEQRRSAARIHHLMQDAIQEVRRMSHSLSPASVKNRGLGGALHLLAETIRTNHRTACTCEVHAEIKIEDAEKETHIYRIAQEAANNALRHGHPTNIKLSLQRLGDHEAVLKIEDNGTGLGKRAHENTGIGLRVMDYRANLIDGSLEIRSRPRGGVCVICRFPCCEDEQD